MDRCALLDIHPNPVRSVSLCKHGHGVSLCRKRKPVVIERRSTTDACRGKFRSRVVYSVRPITSSKGGSCHSSSRKPRRLIYRFRVLKYVARASLNQQTARSQRGRVVVEAGGVVVDCSACLYQFPNNAARLHLCAPYVELCAWCSGLTEDRSTIICSGCRVLATESLPCRSERHGCNWSDIRIANPNSRCPCCGTHPHRECMRDSRSNGSSSCIENGRTSSSERN